ncbi:VOC family protein [Luteibacter aegosomatissinici]|uniref:VOC family protein n=1 Tax=Luteibacter aegosomatissinici TaxID=2911539 RepID=UPI001FF82DDF|nr:VOC family protein [Luteibacter aegosomatissinici]UPG92787.1 VOC family protein [Luteibacter aegosomatissinici]
MAVATFERNDLSPFADMRGHHVAVRTADIEMMKRWYREKLDFRVVAEWSHAHSELAFLAPPADDGFLIEILGGDEASLRETPQFAGFGRSLANPGYHHFCLNVASVDATIAELRARGVDIIVQPFVVEAIDRRIAFFADPFGNVIELAEVLA